MLLIVATRCLSVVRVSLLIHIQPQIYFRLSADEGLLLIMRIYLCLVMRRARDTSASAFSLGLVLGSLLSKSLLISYTQRLQILSIHALSGEAL